MSENNLFQLAQVITDLPMHQDSPMTDSPRPMEIHLPLMPRKNACIVCAVCFTCSGYYGMNCNCCEAQPRRGKNLPQGGLDSRAKKLVSDDKDDYEFTLKWLDEFANQIYRDRENHRILGLNDLTEVSLCKAHSSTLYRAKKRHQRIKAPPSPADSNGTLERRASSADPSYPVLPHPYSPPSGGGGSLAAKVREISYQYHKQPPTTELPDFSSMTASASMKRKRTATSATIIKQEHLHHHHPHHHQQQQHKIIPNDHHQHHHIIHHKSSASTPLYAQNRMPPPVESFSSQLPPLLNNNNNNNNSSHNHNVNSLSSSLQHQLQLNTIETVSLKSHFTKEYYIRNLVITDNYTFKDLLSEIDFTGTPPPGKRIVISDANHEKIYPMNQAIRNVIRYPSDSHVELVLDLADKASIDWTKYS